MTRRNALVAILFLAACGPPDPSADAGNNNGTNENNDPAPDMGRDQEPSRPSFDFRVVTFNTGRFFDMVCDSGACGGGDYERVLSAAEFDFAADRIADGMEAVDADAILLQEVETVACLDAVQERLEGYDIAEFGEIGGTATLDVGMLIRNANHLETRKHRSNVTLELSNGQVKRFAREFLEVHVERDGKRIVLFTAHFKAKRDDDPAWRLAEAEKAREIAMATAAEFPEALIVLGGDLNDDVGSPPIDAMTLNGGLKLATESIDADDRWTYTFFGDPIAIDHLMYTNVQVADVPEGEARVVRDQLGTYAGSDHAALTALFRVFLD